MLIPMFPTAPAALLMFSPSRLFYRASGKHNAGLEAPSSPILSCPAGQRCRLFVGESLISGQTVFFRR